MYFCICLLDFTCFLVYSIQANANFMSSFLLCYVSTESPFGYDPKGGFWLLFIVSQKPVHACNNQLVNRIFFVWFLGFAFGTLFAVLFRSLFSALMCSAVLQPVSIVGLAVSTVLPLFLLALAFYNHKRWILYFVCFYKAFSHFFCAASIYVRYQSAGWIVYFLVMFSDFFTLLFILVLSLIYAMNQLRTAGVCLHCSVIILLMVCGVAYFWISPLLIDIF